MGVTIAWVLIVLILCTTGVAFHALDVLRDRRLSRPRDAEALLAERFAQGEIDEAEYAARLSTLRLGPPLQIH